MNNAANRYGLAGERFWKYVRKSMHGCWEWTGWKDRYGYGRVAKVQRGLRVATVSAHRLSYEMHVDDPSFGLLILHSCDNPGCVNPAHLREGTMAENSADAVSRGRTHTGKHLRDEHARLIRDLAPTIPAATLASAFQATREAVLDIIAGRSHVSAGGQIRARQERTHCREGHPFDTHAYRLPSNGERRCRLCENARSKRTRRKRVAAARVAVSP